MEYSWKIESTDPVSNTMVVEYTYSTYQAIRVNIPMPGTTLDEADLAAWVARYVPVHIWVAAEAAVSGSVPSSTVAVGATGTATYAASEATATTAAPATSGASTTVGSWNEEYLRALIYQVIEEINATNV